MTEIRSPYFDKLNIIKLNLQILYRSCTCLIRSKVSYHDLIFFVKYM